MNSTTKNSLIVLGLMIVFVVILIIIQVTNSPKPPIEKQPTVIPVTGVSQTVTRPVIGIRYRMIDKQTADQNKLVEGAYITQIIKDSPAEKANLQEEDIIIEFDGKKITTDDKEILAKLVTEKKSGDKIALKIWRNKEIKIIPITLN